MSEDEDTRGALSFPWRVLVLGLLFLLGLWTLAKGLYDVQVRRSAKLSSAFLHQSLRRVQTPGARGRIFDRNGVMLADNRPGYCIAFYAEELRQRGAWSHTIDAVNGSIDRLAAVLGVPRQISATAVSNHVMRSLPMPILAWRDVDQTTLARWAAHAEDFPGTDVYVQPERVYPLGTLAAHVLGYVSRGKPEPLQGEKIHFYLPEMEGRVGVELQNDARLAGSTGGRLLQVDARGYKTGVWTERPAARGGDIQLSLDVPLQSAFEEAFRSRGYQGAGVALDPRTGEVLAMVSAPGFDPNDFVPVMNVERWKTLNADPRHPLLNRATQGIYAPGSTFKVLTTIAAVTAGWDTNEVYDCQGAFKFGDMRLRCWGGYPHGELALEKAIEKSCNAFFCQLGIFSGWEAISDAAARGGLGSRTGIDLPYESAGLLPSSDWKRRRYHENWTVGDTCHCSIGQGALLTTPLQMAVVCAAIANGGVRVRPQLEVSAPQPWEPRTELPVRGEPTGWNADALAAVRSGMRAVAAHGTGRRAEIPGLKIAAKTGTAEVDVDGVRQKNTWIIAYAPADAQPSLAVALVVEKGESGGLTAAAVARDVFAQAFGNVVLQSEQGEDEP